MKRADGRSDIEQFLQEAFRRSQRASESQNEWANSAARHHRRVASTPRPVTREDLLPLLGGDIAMAGVAIFLCASFDATAIALYLYFIGDDASAWSTTVVVAFGLISIVASALLGRWLFNLRTYVARGDDLEELESIRRKRRSFTIGAMILYVPMTPVLWGLFVSIACSFS